ncbi:MAG: RcnB family protein [Proteobacteria bacterium]|nr:RcnB family protein [Pseudomonadota bacterium]
MTVKRLLLTAGAVACLVAPVAAFAQGDPHQRKPGEQSGPASTRNARTGRLPRRDAAQHAQQRSEWRGGHPSAASSTIWRSNPAWWRTSPRFRGYHGPRVNYYYAPGYGYYSVPIPYRGRHWSLGELLPMFFRRYVMHDYRDYGLPAPPPGCAWVWVGADVLLVDLSDGYVIDRIEHVY